MAVFEVMGGQKFRPRHVLIWGVFMSATLKWLVFEVMGGRKFRPRHGLIWGVLMNATR